MTDDDFGRAPIMTAGMAGMDTERVSPPVIETEFLVYRWAGDGTHGLEFVRSAFVKHVIGESVGKDLVIEELRRSEPRLTAGIYSYIPRNERVDFEVIMEMRLS